jgi:hypothetical protein
VSEAFKRELGMEVRRIAWSELSALYEAHNRVMHRLGSSLRPSVSVKEKGSCFHCWRFEIPVIMFHGELRCAEYVEIVLNEMEGKP